MLLPFLLPAASACSARKQNQMPGETILIIEDDPTMLRGLKDNFEFEGYCVATASDGDEIPLTPKEFSLLEFFLRQPERAMTRDEILNCVWCCDVLVTARSVDRCVNTLRVKIKPAPKRPRFIQAVRPIGCRFEIE